MKYIEVKNLCFSYDNRKTVLKNVSFNIPGKGVYILMGENGSGKTTILKILIKFVKGFSGMIKIKGRNLRDISLSDISKEIAFLESEIPDIPLTVGEVLSWGKFPYGRKILESNPIIEKLGLSKFIEKDFLTLSSGERKRVLLGRIFVQDADIVLIDEPFNFLDPRYKVEIAILLKELSKERAVLITTHDLNAARFLGERIFLLKKGEIKGTVSKEELFYGNTLTDIFGIKANMKEAFSRFYDMA